MGPIGVFDSGYGGLTVLKELVQKLPDYDFLYMGDNARSPYGTRSFETVYKYTLECVQWLLNQHCPLIIVACNTASAKALRTIQQNDLHKLDPMARVLGVIRPTSEIIGDYSITKCIGILATPGTVQSESYIIEIQKNFPELTIVQESCTMWVPLVENNEYKNEGADYFIKKHIDSIFSKNKKIDTLLLACTHYPLLKNEITKFLPPHIKLLSQGEIVAKSLEDYLKRHPEIEEKLSRNKRVSFVTTDAAEDFNKKGSIFFGEPVSATHIDL